ncbi:unnamed protein product [Vicia faba]|uniref:Pentatricopeptide repeat-containing protein n=1 Tax=Vicia faba TaxID=3906 RepID=A0AAV0Z3E2_VICFA|nr:unnamed protein product [Vicia faba]
MRYYHIIRNLCTPFRSHSPPKFNPHSSSFTSSSSTHSILTSLNLQQNPDSDENYEGVFQQISSVFYGGQSVQGAYSEEIDATNEFEKIINISQLPNSPQSNIALRRKEASREKKRKCIFNTNQEQRFCRIIESCGKILGIEATLELFDKVERPPGVIGYNALIKICIGKAREAENEDIAIEEMGKVFHLFELMREQGYQR